MRALWTGVFVLVLVAGQAAVGMRASATASITGDEPFYLLTTQSLLSDGDLDLRDEYAGREYERFWDGRVELWRQMEPAENGRLLSPHDPGLSLLILPAYAVGGLAGAQRFLVVLWAAAMATSAVVAARMGAPPGASALAAVAIGASAPGVVYASQLYPEAAAALAVSVGLAVAGGSKPRPVVMALAVAALGWLGVKYGAIGLVILLAWGWKFRSERRAVATLAAFVALAAVHSAWWHLATFGGLTPYATNVVWAGEGTVDIVADHIDVVDRSYRLYGVFLDARFGLLRWVPFAVIAVWGAGRRTFTACALVATATLVAAFASITIMGWWFPTRLLVAVLPAVVILGAFGTARLPRAAVALAMLGIAVAAAVAVSAHTGGVRLAVDPWEVGVPLLPAWLFPDFRAFGLREVGVSLAWGIGVGGARLLSEKRRRRAPTAGAHEIPNRFVGVSP